MREPKTWVFGDAHGAFKALKQIFERAPIQEGDTIISLGDTPDGWSEVYECVELLLSMRKKYNMIFIKGNHDDWTLTMMTTGAHPGLPQGGRSTLDSYLKHGDGKFVIPHDHLAFFQFQHLYYKDKCGRIFVHGGFNRHQLLEEQSDPSVFYWDRDLWMSALSWKAMNKGVVMRDPEYQHNYKFKIKEPCTEIFIGHTPTLNWSTDESVTSFGIIIPGNRPCTTPMQAGPVWNLDTGAAYEGVLTIMDVETKEFWQSDTVQDLYPNECGRRKKN